MHRLFPSLSSTRGNSSVPKGRVSLLLQPPPRRGYRRYRTKCVGSQPSARYIQRGRDFLLKRSLYGATSGKWQLVSQHHEFPKMEKSGRARRSCWQSDHGTRQDGVCVCGCWDVVGKSSWFRRVWHEVTEAAPELRTPCLSPATWPRPRLPFVATPAEALSHCECQMIAVYLFFCNRNETWFACRIWHDGWSVKAFVMV